jgi:hypothetical protein
MKKINTILFMTAVQTLSVLFPIDVFSQENADENLSDKKNSKNIIPVKEIKDPFADRSNGMQMNGAGIAPANGITLLGIIIMKSGKKFAALKIPGYKNSFIVSEKTEINIEYRTNSGTTARMTLLVKEISSNKLTLSSRNKPEKLFIIR